MSRGSSNVPGGEDVKGGGEVRSGPARRQESQSIFGDGNPWERSKPGGEGLQFTFLLAIGLDPCGQWTTGRGDEHRVPVWRLWSCSGESCVSCGAPCPQNLLSCVSAGRCLNRGAMLPHCESG